MTKEKGLNKNQKRFCEEYVFDFNGKRSYQVAYKNVKDNTAEVNASKLLSSTKVKEYINELESDLSKLSGISRLKVIREHEKIAFNSIAHLHNTWIERTAFEELTDEQKTCIESIDTRIRSYKDKEKDVEVEVEQIKIKLYDKQKALDSIAKMLGYNEPEKIDLNQNHTIDNETRKFLERLDEKFTK